MSSELSNVGAKSKQGGAGGPDSAAERKVGVGTETSEMPSLGDQEWVGEEGETA